MPDLFAVDSIVRLICVPDNVQDDGEFHTHTMLVAGLNRTFRVSDLGNGLVGIDVGELTGTAAYMHTIDVESDCLEEEG